MVEWSPSIKTDKEVKMNKEELKNLTNEELDKLLNEVDWCDRDLLREYDERKYDGRIQFSGEFLEPEDLEEHFRKRRERLKEKESRQIKKAS